MRCVVVAAGLLLALPLGAQTEPSATAPGGSVCIRAIDIDHTRTPDNRTILFYMRDGRVWQSKLTSYCPEIAFDGFSYLATPPDDVCGNLQTIRSNRSGAICEMGPLVPVTAPSRGS